MRTIGDMVLDVDYMMLVKLPVDFLNLSRDVLISLSDLTFESRVVRSEYETVVLKWRFYKIQEQICYFKTHCTLSMNEVYESGETSIPCAYSKICKLLNVPCIPTQCEGNIIPILGKLSVVMV